MRDMETSAVDFVNHLHEAAPMRIDKLLTDNGACFTDRPAQVAHPPRQASLRRAVSRWASSIGFCPPRHPQTNGLVEALPTAVLPRSPPRPDSPALPSRQTLMNYVKVYNTRIPQRALDHHTPARCPQVLAGQVALDLFRSGQRISRVPDISGGGLESKFVLLLAD